MPYDPTRRYTPRERFEAREADRRAAEAKLTHDERLLRAWAGYSDAEVLAAVRAGNQKRDDKEIRLRVARLRGLLPAETDAERQKREARDKAFGEALSGFRADDEDRLTRRPPTRR